MFSHEELASRVDPSTLERAQSTIDNRCVERSYWDGTRLHGRFRSGDTGTVYTTSIDQQLDGHCDCVASRMGRGALCKHALGLALLLTNLLPRNQAIASAPGGSATSALLEAILADPRRTSVLLLSPEPHGTSDWAFLVGWHFRDALDIEMAKLTSFGERHTVWLQGRAFRFREGDVLHARAGGGLAGITLQVDAAVAADREGASGEVHFSAYLREAGSPAPRRARLEASQHDFARLLVSGVLCRKPLGDHL